MFRQDCQAAPSRASQYPFDSAFYFFTGPETLADSAGTPLLASPLNASRCRLRLLGASGARLPPTIMQRNDRFKLPAIVAGLATHLDFVAGATVACSSALGGRILRTGSDRELGRVLLKGEPQLRLPLLV